jgi:hypothetical protein
MRCHSSADPVLLLEGTGLRLQSVEMAGRVLDPAAQYVAADVDLLDAYSYLATLVRCGEGTKAP